MTFNINLTCFLSIMRKSLLWLDTISDKIFRLHVKIKFYTDLITGLNLSHGKNSEITTLPWTQGKRRQPATSAQPAVSKATAFSEEKDQSSSLGLLERGRPTPWPTLSCARCTTGTTPAYWSVLDQTGTNMVIDILELMFILCLLSFEKLASDDCKTCLWLSVVVRNKKFKINSND